MRRVLSIVGLLFRILGLILIVIGSWSNFNEFEPKSTPEIQNVIQQGRTEILAADDIILKIKDSIGVNKSFLPWEKLLKDNNIDAVLFYQGKPLEWTTQDYQLTPQIGDHFYIQNQNGVPWPFGIWKSIIIIISL